MALNMIASEQMVAMEQTFESCTQLLDYLASNSNAAVWYYASNMVMNIHSDASYLSKAKAQSCTCGHFFMGWIPKNGEPIKLNGTFHVDSSILHFDVASAAKAELGALFHNCQTGIIFWSILEDLGHPQPQTPVHCNNATAVGIANSTVKWQQSRSMEMRFCWISSKVAQDMYALAWHLGQENLADYQSKHHMGSDHLAVRWWYLHMKNSPHFLPRAQTPSALKGCVGTLDGGYLCKVPLPWAPWIQSPGHVTCPAVTEHDKRDTCYSQGPRIPTWSDLVRSHAGFAGSTMLQLAPVWLM